MHQIRQHDQAGALIGLAGWASQASLDQIPPCLAIAHSMFQGVGQELKRWLVTPSEAIFQESRDSLNIRILALLDACP